MKTGFKLIHTVVAAAAVLALAPAYTTAQTAKSAQAAGAATGKPGKAGIGYQPPEYLVTRSDVIADLGIKVEKGTAPKAVLATLTPAQRKRLDQIAWQMQGHSALRTPEVQQALKISAAQEQKLEQLAADNVASIGKVFESDLSDEESQDLEQMLGPAVKDGSL